MSTQFSPTPTVGRDNVYGKGIVKFLKTITIGLLLMSAFLPLVPAIGLMYLCKWMCESK